MPPSPPPLLPSADGPDEPRLEARPARPFYVAGGSLSLSCQAEGLPKPTAKWSFSGEELPGSSGGVLNLTDVQTSQGGTYTCNVINPETKKERQESVDVNIYGAYFGGRIDESQCKNVTVIRFEVVLL